MGRTAWIPQRFPWEILPNRLPRKQQLSPEEEEYAILKAELISKKLYIEHLRRKTLGYHVKPFQGKYHCNPAGIEEMLRAQEDFYILKAELLARKRAKSSRPVEPTEPRAITPLTRTSLPPMLDGVPAAVIPLTRTSLLPEFG